jgi:hypothetical protein
VTLALAVAACHDLTLDPNHVVEIRVLNSAPIVLVGDTLRMTAQAFNAAGQPVTAAVITWASLDTAVSPHMVIDASGLIHGISAGLDSIQAAADSQRTDPIHVNVDSLPVDSVPSMSPHATVPLSGEGTGRRPERGEGVSR